MNEDLMKWIAGVLVGVGWFVLVIMKLADVDTFVQFAQYFLVGMAAHGATVSASPRLAPVVVAPVVPPAQAGRSGIEFLVLLFCVGLVIFLLSGCAGLNAQGVLTITYNSPTVKTDATLLPGVLSGVGP